jgi:hypothetical protein
MTLIDYVGCLWDDPDGEWFKVAISTTGGIREEVYRYKWIDCSLFIESEAEVSGYECMSWSELLENVESETSGWFDLTLIEVKKAIYETLDFKLSGWKPCNESEIERYNKLQEQVSQVEENKRKVELEKIAEARETLETLEWRYKEKYAT